MSWTPAHPHDRQPAVRTGLLYYPSVQGTEERAAVVSDDMDEAPLFLNSELGIPMEGSILVTDGN